MPKDKDSKWQCYIIPDLATWSKAADSAHTPIEFYSSYEQAAARFLELRSEPYNSEGLSDARLTFGIQRNDPPSAADLLQVRCGKNYLVADYTRMETVNQSPAAMEILCRMQKDLGFERVRIYEPGCIRPKDLAFVRWKHPLKPTLSKKSILKELKDSGSPSSPASKTSPRKKEKSRE